MITHDDFFDISITSPGTFNRKVGVQNRRIYSLILEALRPGRIFLYQVFHCDRFIPKYRVFPGHFCSRVTFQLSIHVVTFE